MKFTKRKDLRSHEVEIDKKDITSCVFTGIMKKGLWIYIVTTKNHVFLITDAERKRFRVDKAEEVKPPCKLITWAKSLFR